MMSLNMGLIKKKRINSQRKNQKQEQDSEVYVTIFPVTGSVNNVFGKQTEIFPILVFALEDALLTKRTTGLELQQDDKKLFLHY